MKKNMTFKRKYYLLTMIIVLLFLNSCSLDDYFEGDHGKETDRDDVNIIHKIGAQSFDKAQKIYIDSMSQAS